MEKYSKHIKMILPACFVLLLFSAGVSHYTHSIQKALWNQAVSEIQEVTSQSSHAFEVFIEKDMQILKRVVNHLALDGAGDKDAILEIVGLSEDDEISFTVIDVDHGIMYAREDGAARQIGEEQLAVYRAYGEKGFGEPYIDEFTGRRMIGGYQRFTFLDGTQGIVQVRRQLSAVADEFMLSFYNNAGFSYISNREGDILVSLSHKDSRVSFTNIFEAIAFSGETGEGELGQFRDSLRKKEEGVMRFVFDGEKNIIAFAPVSGTDGWYLVAIVPDAVILKNARQVLQSSRAFMALIGGIFVVVAMVYFIGRRTQKKIMEKEEDVKYREQMFDILANNTDDIFLMFTTTDYEIEYISPNIERILGVPQQEARENIRVLERMCADDGENINYDMVKELQAGGSVEHEGERIHRKSGERRWFKETVFKTAANGSERYVAVLSDRTNEQRSENALREALAIAKSANESKSVFLSSMSHDIRTPMNAIVGFSTLLQRDAHYPDRVQEYTRKIMASSQHLLGLINDVLDMSKIESGKTTLNISEISLAELVDGLMAMMQPQARAKNQEFKISVYDICNENLLGDHLRINQILINILSNALKYTPSGGSIRMTVRQMPQQTKNYARFQFVITDNGIGMSEEYLKTIFQPFSREEGKKTSKIQGTGLGMAITKNLVDLMGGSIEVESKMDVGSTFRLELNLRILDEEADPDFWAAHGVTSLLVVDDEEEICTGIQRAIADTGIAMEYALGGQDAVRMAQDAKECGRGFDVVLIDWQMPDISGIETARRIRKIVPAHVPVMILTAYDISRIEEEGMAAGIDGFLQKPFFLSNFKCMVGDLKEGESQNEKPEPAEGEDSLMGRYILAAEDNELNAEILMELLKMAGAECDWVENGQRALERFEESAPDKYDMILMDVQMPVMDGYEATRRIRSCPHPRAKDIPIIAMTANAFSEDVRDALEAGMNEHVAKPVDMDRLKAAVKQLLER